MARSQKFATVAAVFLGLIALATAGVVVFGYIADSQTQRVTLLSRQKHRDYEKSTFSFEHGLRDDPGGITRNDWDLSFGGRGEDDFHVNMVTDDCSRIQDLGVHTWRSILLSNLPDLPAHPAPAREPHVKARVGHMYLVHTRDSETDLYALFRVESLESRDRCEITWKLVDVP